MKTEWLSLSPETHISEQKVTKSSHLHRCAPILHQSPVARYWFAQSLMNVGYFFPLHRANSLECIHLLLVVSPLNSYDCDPTKSGPLSVSGFFLHHPYLAIKLFLLSILYFFSFLNIKSLSDSFILRSWCCQVSLTLSVFYRTEQEE